MLPLSATKTPGNFLQGECKESQKEIKAKQLEIVGLKIGTVVNSLNGWKILNLAKKAEHKPIASKKLRETQAIALFNV